MHGILCKCPHGSGTFYTTCVVVAGVGASASASALTSADASAGAVLEVIGLIPSTVF